MEPPPLTREQCRELDRRAIEEYGICGLVLMENAGRGCVDVLERLGIAGPVVVLCGKGNNAGDGFVIARHLDIRGHACRALLLCPPDELTGDGAKNFAILQKTDVPISEFDASLKLGGAAWLIDAMLGTGARGEPRPPFDAAIDWLNARASAVARSPDRAIDARAGSGDPRTARDPRTAPRVLAVDVPSGLDCDTGQPAAHTVRADHTCTFAAMKSGFTQAAAKPFTGTVHVCDIGVPRRLIAESRQ